jgi:DNA-binding transcriptional LysR family regulator
MTLEQLRVFVAVAEALHVTRAAQRLNLTQSAASAAVAALESRYATRLFHRVGRRIELTEAGRLFLGEAKAVLQRAAAAELALSELAGLQRGALSIHASQTIANYWLPALLHRFRRAYPKVTLNLVIGNTAQVAKAVLDGAADLGFVEGETDEPALARETLAGDQLALVVGIAHPWAGRKRLDPSRLVETDWVLREPGSGTRSEFEAALGRFGIDPRALRVVLELPSNEAVRSAVEAGAGATVLSRLVAEAGLRAGVLHQIALPLPERPFHVLRHRERYRSEAERALLALVPGRLRASPRRSTASDGEPHESEAEAGDEQP